jgi:hypothetical protein
MSLKQFLSDIQSGTERFITYPHFGVLIWTTCPRTRPQLLSVFQLFYLLTPFKKKLQVSQLPPQHRNTPPLDAVWCSAQPAETVPGTGEVTQPAAHVAPSLLLILVNDAVFSFIYGAKAFVAAFRPAWQAYH